MSAVLLAVFNRFGDAQRVRTRLVSDGFPTDRVEVTASEERGRAGLQPGTSAREQFEQYFSTLLARESERELAQHLAERVAEGSVAIVAVHPRGGIETSRATQILTSEGAREVVSHDLEKQSYEFAASAQDTAMVRHFLPAHPEQVHCLYCWLFPDRVHPH